MALEYSLDPQLPEYTPVDAETPDVEETTSSIGNTYTGVQEGQNTIADSTTPAAQPQFDIGKTSQDVSTYAPIETGESNVSAPSLVQNQLSSILDPNSDLMMAAKSRGQVAAKTRGQLGSTAGIRASQGAMMDQAESIATKDAGTYAQAGLTAQQAKNTQAQTMTEAAAAGTLAQQEASINERKFALNNSFQAAINKADNETKAILQDQMIGWEEASMKMQNDFNAWSTQYQTSATVRENMLNRLADAQINHQIVVQELLGDPSFLELGGAAISNLMNTMVAGVASTMKSNMTAAGYVSTDPAMNAMLDDWVSSMELVDYSGI